MFGGRCRIVAGRGASLSLALGIGSDAGGDVVGSERPSRGISLGSWAGGRGAPAGHDGGKGVRPVSAFATRPGAATGQLRVAPEGNEAAALALLKSLPLKGAAVTGDAAFCRRALCKAIREAFAENRLKAIAAVKCGVL